MEWSTRPLVSRIGHRGEPGVDFISTGRRNRPFRAETRSLGALMLLAIAGVALTEMQGQSQPVVGLNQVWLETVKQGDIKLEVRGPGRLTSAHTAALKLAESEMRDVRQGQPAIIEFPNLHETVGAKVAVVHPGVANGTMTVDVQMDDAPPPGINLQEAVYGMIRVGGLTNVVYLGRQPAFAVANSVGTLFKVEPDGHSAKRVPVQFGATSANLIEIKSGMHPGDKVILSDMSQFEKVDVIVLR